MSLVRSLLVSAAGLLAAAAAAQVTYRDPAAWDRAQLERRRAVVRVLTGWGAANVAAGTVVGLSADTECWRQFGWMSAGWGAVNAALGGFGLRAVRRDLADSDRDFTQAHAEHQRLRRVLLFNAGLDVAYVAGGFYLRERANRSGNADAERDRGWGLAVIAQGAALFAFDLLAERHLAGARIDVRPVGAADAVGLSTRVTF